MVLSVRGNGANWLPFGLEPALLAAGWVLLAMRWRGQGWRLTASAAVLAGLLDLVPAALLVWSAITPDPGLSRKPSFAVLIFPLLLLHTQVAWALVAPALVTALPVRTSSLGVPGRQTLQAMALLPLSMAVGACGFAWTTSVLLP